MKGCFRTICPLLFLVLVVIPGAAGWEVRNCTITPDGDLPSGTPIDLSVRVVFPTDTDWTFPDASDLSLSTDLADAVWTYSLIVDGTEYPQPFENRRYWTLDGNKLAYPSGSTVTLILHVHGTAPVVASPTDIKAIRIMEIDTDNCNCISNAKPFERIVRVYNPANPAAAWTVTNVSVDPSGSLTPGTPVVVFIMMFFPEEHTEDLLLHEIRFSTGLDRPKWTWGVIADGYENYRVAENGKNFSLPDYTIPGSGNHIPQYEGTWVHLEGIAPEITRTKNITIFRVEELDEKDVVVHGTTHEYTTMVINTCCIRSGFPDKKAELDTFRSHIDEKVAMGINTSTAEEKYNEAKKIIDDTGAMPSTQYSEAMDNLNNASLVITEGEHLLDKAWAEKEVADADDTIMKTDSIIAQLKSCTGPDRCLWDSPEWRGIAASRENAVRHIEIANDKIGYGNYSAARESAGIAYALGNESYNRIFAFNKTWSGAAPAPLSPWGCIGAIVSAGIFLCRRNWLW